jgi:hypothetical protein
MKIVELDEFGIRSVQVYPFVPSDKPVPPGAAYVEGAPAHVYVNINCVQNLPHDMALSLAEAIRIAALRGKAL